MRKSQISRLETKYIRRAIRRARNKISFPAGCAAAETHGERDERKREGDAASPAASALLLFSPLVFVSARVRDALEREERLSTGSGDFLEMTNGRLRGTSIPVCSARSLILAEFHDDLLITAIANLSARRGSALCSHNQDTSGERIPDVR